ncbi:MAG: potassium-transporting ATPase subunit C [Thermaerobacter sp.]|nr:potassium-transporting ATPase subunit C [Thermaerobacter sp.]
MSVLRAAVGGLAGLLLATAVVTSLSLASSVVVSRIAPPVRVGAPPATPSGRFWERPILENLRPGAVAQAAGRRARELARAMPSQRGAPPASLVTPVGQVADPNIALGAALFQVPRVARATGLSPSYLRGLVGLASARGLFNLGGPPYVNVPWLNRHVAAALSRDR